MISIATSIESHFNADFKYISFTKFSLTIKSYEPEKIIYLKSALKCDSFDVAIDIKIQFFRVLVTIEPGRSLLQFVTTNCLIKYLSLTVGEGYWSKGRQKNW